MPIWRIILNLNEEGPSYSEYKVRVAAEPSLIANVSEVIELDVMRSAHNMSGVDPDALTCLLKTYAHYNPEIAYC